MSETDKVFVTIEEIAKEFRYSNVYTALRAVKRSGVNVISDLVDYEAFSNWWMNDRQANQFDSFPDFQCKVFEPLTIKEEKVIVTADWHIPYFDLTLADKMLLIAERDSIYFHLISGDFYDQQSFSTFRDMEKLPWLVEREAASKVGDKLFSFFKINQFLVGNHDIRAFLNAKLPVDPLGPWFETFLRKDIEDVVSFFPYCFLESGSDKWVIGHPTQVGKTDATLRALSTKYPLHNVMVSHGHKTRIAQSDSGLNVMVEIGGMVKQEYVSWKMKDFNANPNWVPSFATIINGKVKVYSDLFTDWNLELG